MKPRSWLSAALLFSFVYSAFPQDEYRGSIEFKHLSIENGLSQSSVFSVIQDNRGFIWIGTYAGLNKYDGYTFTIFDEDKNNPNSLSHYAIHVIVKDRSGILWIGTEEGLNRFDPATERFQRYFHDPLDTGSLCSNWITSLCVDRSGSLWIGTEQGLDKLEPGNQRFIHYRNNPEHPDNGPSNNMVRCLYLDSRGLLWIGTYGGGLNVYNGRNGRFTAHQNRPMDPRSIRQLHSFGL
jgi:ligand-binding sensor domain-containing protein